ncbi:MAG: hypothetical protein QXN05_04070 [Acidilobaceae archaeon]
MIKLELLQEEPPSPLDLSVEWRHVLGELVSLAILAFLLAVFILSLVVEVGFAKRGR